MDNALQPNRTLRLILALPIGSAVGALCGALATIVFFAIGSAFPIESDVASNMWGMSLLVGTVPVAASVLVAAFVYSEERSAVAVAMAVLVTIRSGVMLVITVAQNLWPGAAAEFQYGLAIATAWIVAAAIARGSEGRRGLGGSVE